MLRRMAAGPKWTVVGAVLLAGCLGPRDYGARGHYQHTEIPVESVSTRQLVSAHVSRYGEPPPLTEAHMLDGGLDGGEHQQDRMLLVFAVELDPVTIDPLSFGVLRADGRRVRPTRVFLAPADEGDENRSLTLIGEFGSAAAPPVAIHIIGTLYAETGEPLQGLDADITSTDEPDRPVVTERLASGPSRCPGARQVVRTYWTDVLTQVGADDLAGIALRLADGRSLAPIEFDDQRQRADDPPTTSGPALGPADDNVLDLCIDDEVAVVHVHFSAGLFTDAGGLPTAAADIALVVAPNRS